MPQGDPFLTGVYDRLHRTPMQEKLRRIAPMPVGVVFVEWPGQKKKAVQKVQAPAQPFITFDPARPPVRAAAPVAYSVVRHLIYTSRLVWTQGWNWNVLAKAKFGVYTPR